MMNNDFLNHQILYEELFSKFQRVLLIKRGYLVAYNYLYHFKDDVYYFKEKDLKVMIFIDREGMLYLYYGEDLVLMKNYDKRVKKEVGFLYKLGYFFKELLFS